MKIYKIISHEERRVFLVMLYFLIGFVGFENAIFLIIVCISGELHIFENVFQIYLTNPWALWNTKSQTS